MVCIVINSNSSINVGMLYDLFFLYNVNEWFFNNNIVFCYICVLIKINVEICILKNYDCWLKFKF